MSSIGEWGELKSGPIQMHNNNWVAFVFLIIYSNHQVFFVTFYFFRIIKILRTLMLINHKTEMSVQVEPGEI